MDLTDNDKPDPPIEPQQFLGGVKVVDIGDLRVARGLSRRPQSACRHRRLHYDAQERRVWCADCEHTVEGFDAFSTLVEYYNGALNRLENREAAVIEAETKALVSRAAKAVDDTWRRHKMAPCCPTCGGGLLPEDFADGVKSRVGREYERARRAKRSKP
jgi:Zn finger protein HypA/HybF involved in hydrogenase expression